MFIIKVHHICIMSEKHLQGISMNQDQENISEESFDLLALSRFVFMLLFFLLTAQISHGQNSKTLLDSGWASMLKDYDVEAFIIFNEAHKVALAEKDTENVALSLLYMGICTYSSSYTEGMEYSIKSMDEFKKFESPSPEKALTGRSKVLQLISTINSRQGKFRESVQLSKQALLGFPESNDSSGYLGLIYNTLGVAYTNLQMQDSASYFHRKALEERLQTRNFMYLPGSYSAVAKIEISAGEKELSKNYIDRAIKIADSTGNRQAFVLSYLVLGDWFQKFLPEGKDAEQAILTAKEIARSLSDRSFYLKSLDALIKIKKQNKNFESALALEEEEAQVRDSLYSWEKQKIQKSLEVQFDVSEKERLLKLTQRENEVARLTNYLLWAIIGFVTLIALGIIYFLKRNNERNKLLLQTKEALVIAIEEQKHLREKQLQNELEFKESQLTAMTAQMLQKNELMHELKNKLEEDKNISKDSPISKIINKGQNQDRDWSDFNSHFESINKNFYSRLRQSYPEISPNDLKICALIKLNLSIKEMAAILNISPDSVKTARYRLRKKLQLNTEDNLTDFILNLQ